ncbi:hypothetical protein ES332_D07G224700v1 [Gossypium tomentosum]|uniref:Uncharacterized protein n=1 Tax=Gossypium tomentosum TaxID=34277 RepID=A0A5D2K9S0_GOSTO|nr:hypothetical protein ES332_D07G224700v1 [Gossypium tomentosum]
MSRSQRRGNRKNESGDVTMAVELVATRGVAVGLRQVADRTCGGSTRCGARVSDFLKP